MAWYEIEYSCGHTVRQQQYGKGAERERYRDWAAKSGTCPECFKAQKSLEKPKFAARLCEGGCEIYCYSNSFAIKDTLKKRGYKFGEYSAPNAGMIALGIAYTGRGTLKPPNKGWGITWLTYEMIALEMAWVANQGFELRVQNTTSSILQSVLEGRPDLLNPQPPEAMM